MTQRKPRTNATLVRVSPPPAPTPPMTSYSPRTASSPPKSSASGWLGLGAVVILLFVVGKCSSSGSSTSSAVEEAAAGNAQQAIVTAVQAQSTPPVEALSRKAVGRGLSHVSLATPEGLAGEMIYSQNCYDALGRKFSWAKLDQCGAFDAAAALSLEDDETAAEGTEAAWFQSEAAAGRFLKAATAAGEPAEEADTRWSDLQGRVSAKHKSQLPAPTASPTGSEVAPTVQPSEEDALGNVAV